MNNTRTEKGASAIRRKVMKQLVAAHMGIVQSLVTIKTCHGWNMDNCEDETIKAAYYALDTARKNLGAILGEL